MMMAILPFIIRSNLKSYLRNSFLLEGKNVCDDSEQCVGGMFSLYTCRRRRLGLLRLNCGSNKRGKRFQQEKNKVISALLYHGHFRMLGNSVYLSMALQPFVGP
jgi:hypothetical protein